LSAHIWDTHAENANITDQFEIDPDNTVDFFDWSPDGRELAALSNNAIYLWNSASRILERTFVLDGVYVGDTVDFRWSPSGRYIAIFEVGFGTGVSYVYDTAANTYTSASTYFLHGTAEWSPNDELLSLNWGTWGDPTPPRSISPSLSRLQPPYFSWGTRDSPASAFSLIGLTHNTQQGFLSPVGQYVAAIDDLGSGMVWNTTNGQAVTMLSDAAQVMWSPDEKLFVVQRLDGSLWILDANGSIREQLPISPGPQKPIGTFYWSPDSSTLAHLYEGVVDLWQIDG
jgi:WD40 repeat protein